MRVPLNVEHQGTIDVWARLKRFGPATRWRPVAWRGMLSGSTGQATIADLEELGMPYYSVRISGDDCENECIEARDTFQGRPADYTGNNCFFYVQRDYSLDQLKKNVESVVGNDCEVEVKKITKSEWEWKKGNKSS